MIRKKLTWHRLENGIYKIANYSDDSVFTLALFLQDGLGSQSYIDFLENDERKEFSGNISLLEKQGKMVTIFLDDYIFPDLPTFTTTIENLIMILKEFKRLRKLETNNIKLILEDDTLNISAE